MRIARLTIENFRGIVTADLIFPSHAMVIIGDNNVGKSTVLDALDLVLGPERLTRRPIIDEHDFYFDKYLDTSGQPVKIKIEATIVGLTEAQQAKFNANIEWWNTETKQLVENIQPQTFLAGGPDRATSLGIKGNKRFDVLLSFT